MAGYSKQDQLKKRTKKPKYNNKRTVYNGVAYDSNLEAEYAKKLDWRKRAGEVLSWKGQKSLHLIVNGVTVCRYIIDFEVELVDGTKEYVEVKGFETRLWKLKWDLLRALRGTNYDPIPDGRLVLVKKGGYRKEL